MQSTENLIINPQWLMQHKQADSSRILVLDLSAVATYQQGTVPDAINMPFEGLVNGELPHPSMLPSAAQFATALAATGYDGSQHIVAFDDEFGLKAARLYWTLRMTQLHRFSYLNGGLAAWKNSGGEVAPPSAPPAPAGPLPLKWNLASGPRVTKEQILAALPQQEFFLWDTRSAAEYSGAERFAEKGGHIPGAHHLEWKTLLNEDGRIKAPEEIKQILASFFAARPPAQPIAAYCQAHRRSAFAFMAAAYAGFDILGYDGSWQEWGNSSDTPVAAAAS